MRIGVKSLVASGMTLTMLALGAGAAQAQAPQLENGKTKAVYDYKTAVRERVFIPQPGIDADRNGKMDWVTADVIRPARVARRRTRCRRSSIRSPYYMTRLSRQRRPVHGGLERATTSTTAGRCSTTTTSCRAATPTCSAQMNGTGVHRPRLPDARRPDRHRGREVRRRLAQRPREGLQGRQHSTARPRSSSNWHNGSSAMIGKSYDGTLSNGVAATGVEGLKTIVPISAISAWYNYSRTRRRPPQHELPGRLPEPDDHLRRHGPEPARRQPARTGARLCAAGQRATSTTTPTWTPATVTRTATSTRSGASATTTWTPARSRRPSSPSTASRTTTSRWTTLGMWWDALKANNVRTKMWLLRAGHEDPFDSRRAEWVDTLHRWFDH